MWEILVIIISIISGSWNDLYNKLYKPSAIITNQYVGVQLKLQTANDHGVSYITPTIWRLLVGISGYMSGNHPQKLGYN